MWFMIQCRKAIRQFLTISLAVIILSSQLLSVSFANPLTTPVLPIVTPIPMLQAIHLVPNDAFRLQMMIHPDGLSPDSLEFRRHQKMIMQYFLTALTIPETDVWVNLSPFEQHRIIAENFGQTKMGRDVLQQDYNLKELISEVLHPEHELGRQFWTKMQSLSQQQLGETEIAASAFNKIWIVPEYASLFEHDTGVWVTESRFKVMVAEDYYALDHAQGENAELQTEQSRLITEAVREILIPAIEHEVNHGELFANLRQIYQAILLASWYKQNLQEAPLTKVYANQNLVITNDSYEKDIQLIYQDYVTKIESGAFDYIKQEYRPEEQTFVINQYVSGGVQITTDHATLGNLPPEIANRPYVVTDVSLNPQLQTRRDFLTRAGALVGLGMAACVPNPISNPNTNQNPPTPTDPGLLDVETFASAARGGIAFTPNGDVIGADYEDGLGSRVVLQIAQGENLDQLTTIEHNFPIPSTVSFIEVAPNGQYALIGTHMEPIQAGNRVGIYRLDLNTLEVEAEPLILMDGVFSLTFQDDDHFFVSSNAGGLFDQTQPNKIHYVSLEQEQVVHQVEIASFDETPSGPITYHNGDLYYIYGQWDPSFYGTGNDGLLVKFSAAAVNEAINSDNLLDVNQADVNHVISGGIDVVVNDAGNVFYTNVTGDVFLYIEARDQSFKVFEGSATEITSLDTIGSRVIAASADQLFIFDEPDKIAMNDASTSGSLLKRILARVQPSQRQTTDNAQLAAVQISEQNGSNAIDPVGGIDLNLASAQITVDRSTVSVKVPTWNEESKEYLLGLEIETMISLVHQQRLVANANELFR